MIQSLLIFDIEGKFAHFRKFYTNMSSLTYTIPPKTVVAGILSSILKYERDTYYSKFSNDNFKIAISIKKPIKKHFECLNYKNEKDGGRTQVRMEMILPTEDIIQYRIFLWHKDEEILEKLKKKMNSNMHGFGTYLGQRQFISSTKVIDYVKRNKIKKIKHFQGEITSSIATDNVVGTDDISKIIDYEEGSHYVRERVPTEFKKTESGREIENLKNVIIEINKSKINIKKDSRGKIKEAYQIRYNDKEKEILQNIAFL